MHCGTMDNSEGLEHVALMGWFLLLPLGPSSAFGSNLRRDPDRAVRLHNWGARVSHSGALQDEQSPWCLTAPGYFSTIMSAPTGCCRRAVRGVGDGGHDHFLQTHALVDCCGLQQMLQTCRPWRLMAIQNPELNMPLTIQNMRKVESLRSVLAST